MAAGCRRRSCSLMSTLDVSGTAPGPGRQVDGRISAVPLTARRVRRPRTGARLRLPCMETARPGVRSRTEQGWRHHVTPTGSGEGEQPRPSRLREDLLLPSLGLAGRSSAPGQQDVHPDRPAAERLSTVLVGRRRRSQRSRLGARFAPLHERERKTKSKQEGVIYGRAALDRRHPRTCSDRPRPAFHGRTPAMVLDALRPRATPWPHLGIRPEAWYNPGPAGLVLTGKAMHPGSSARSRRLPRSARATVDVTTGPPGACRPARRGLGTRYNHESA